MSSQVNFHFIDVDFRLSSTKVYKDWLLNVAKKEGSFIRNIDYHFCSDSHLLEINKEHLDHDYLTDIITFPYQQGKIIESDIFISIDRILDNAKTHQVSEDEELLRVMSHGLLHLIGYGDKTDSEILVMRQKELQAISAFQA